MRAASDQSSQESSAAARVRRPRHAWLYALPGAQMPASVMSSGRRYDHVQTFKHDFFAATGLYRGPDGLAVLKMGRAGDFASLPMAWLGRWLTRREARLYRLLQGSGGVPEFLGIVGADAGFLHVFVPGRPLGQRDVVLDAFFAELSALLHTLHERDIAYVDLNKRQNIIVGDDGRPYLIDFQISLHLPRASWCAWWPARWLLARFQAADRYHFTKHKKRLRPDLLTPAERALVERLSIWIRLHRLVARPLTNLRRRLKKRLARSETSVVAGASAK